MSPPKMLSFKIFLIFGNWTQATWITTESIIITCGVFFDISLWEFANAHKSTGYCDDLKLTRHPDLTVIDSHSLLLQLFSCADIFSRKPRLHDISTPDTLRLSITWGPFLRWLQFYNQPMTEMNSHLIKISQYPEHLWFPLVFPICVFYSWLLQQFL